jgi:hypothetical protein
MKRLLRVVLCLLVGGMAIVSPAALDRLQLVTSVEAQQDPAKITVYITRTGEKYHREGCRHLSRSKIATTLKEAVARGFGACSVCKPPTVN